MIGKNMKTNILNLFTKFYQAYILPKKFKIDKRKSHLSCLIRNQEMEREKALRILENNKYPGNLDEDMNYFCKKIGISRKEFEETMNSSPTSHYSYKNSEKLFHFSKKIYSFFFSQ